MIAGIYFGGVLIAWAIMLRLLSTDPSVGPTGRFILVPVMLLPAFAWPAAVMLGVVCLIGLGVMHVVSSEAPAARAAADATLGSDRGGRR